MPNNVKARQVNLRQFKLNILSIKIFYYFSGGAIMTMILSLLGILISYLVKGGSNLLILIPIVPIVLAGSGYVLWKHFQALKMLKTVQKLEQDPANIHIITQLFNYNLTLVYLDNLLNQLATNSNLKSILKSQTTPWNKPFFLQWQTQIGSWNTISKTIKPNHTTTETLLYRQFKQFLMNNQSQNTIHYGLWMLFNHLKGAIYWKNTPFFSRILVGRKKDALLFPIFLKSYKNCATIWNTVTNLQFSPEPLEQLTPNLLANRLSTDSKQLSEQCIALSQIRISMQQTLTILYTRGCDLLYEATNFEEQTNLIQELKQRQSLIKGLYQAFLNCTNDKK